MGRVVILEGPDGGGKTTLANKLIKAGFEYKHEGPPPIQVDLIAYYLKSLYESIKSPNDVVHDRLWLGERIYGPIARGSDRIGDMGQRLFERLHNSKAIYQYICLPRLTIAKANYAEKIEDKHDYLHSLESWEKVFSGYKTWQENHKLLGSVYDYSTTSNDQVISEVMAFQPTLYNLPDGTVGSREAKFLFVGDKPNHANIDVPFFAVTGSSGYLNRALELLKFKEQDMAFSNARAPSDQFHSLGSILSKLPNLVYIFLMGGVAKDWFYSQSNLKDAYKVIEIPHPSYLKRFKGHNPAVMADIIYKELYG